MTWGEREGGREGGRERGREGGREGEREGGKERRRDGEEGMREGGKEGGQGGERLMSSQYTHTIPVIPPAPSCTTSRCGDIFQPPWDSTQDYQHVERHPLQTMHQQSS